jgi:hypothetical protein
VAALGLVLSLMVVIVGRSSPIDHRVSHRDSEG